MGAGAGLNAAEKRETYTDDGNLTVITRITVDSNTTHLLSIIAATCFGPTGHHQVGKNGRLNTQF